MVSEVGSGQVPVFATFKGFRKSVTSEAEGATKAASGLFTSGFRKVGDDSGKSFGSAFSTSATASIKQATADVARASREVSAARLKEQDAAGKVRLAETQLAESRTKYAAESSQVVRAEERLATAQRSHNTVQSGLVTSTDRLTAAQKSLAAASSTAASSAGRVGSSFGALPPILGSAGSDGARRFSQGFRDVLGGVLGANIITGIGFTIGSQINQGIQAGITYGLQGVQLASDLEQSTGAVSAVFKDQAQTIFDASKVASTGVGLTRAAYLKYSTIVGAQLKNLGLPIDQVSGKTNDLITLGADLAAQFGGPTSDAVGALSSLLRGERDPIERYGVGLKQVDIDARKAALGLSDLTGEADKQADIQATLSLLWEQTADAQGTFFRESDTYAHKQQVLNAQLEESQTRLGEALLPAFSAAAGFANDTLIPALDGVIDSVGPRLTEALTNAGPEFEKLADKALPLIENVITLAGEKGLPALIGVLDEIATEAPEWIEVFGKVDKAANDVWYTLSEGGTFDQARDDRIAWFASITDDFNSNVEPANQAVNDFLRRVFLEPLGGLPEKAREAGELTMKGLARGVKENEHVAIEAATTAAFNVHRATNNALEIRSPSKLFERSGEQIPAGLAIGIRRGTSDAEAAAASMLGVTTAGSIHAPFGSAGAGVLPPIYVQNPFTSEYALAVIDSRAAGVVKSYDIQSQQSTRGGRI